MVCNQSKLHLHKTDTLLYKAKSKQLLLLVLHGSSQWFSFTRHTSKRDLEGTYLTQIYWESSYISDVLILKKFSEYRLNNSTIL